MSLANSIRGAVLPSALMATMALPDSARAEWGEPWSVMGRDAASFLQLPTLTDERVLVLVLCVLLGGAFLTRRRHVGRRAPR